MRFFNFKIEDEPAWKIILRGAAVPGLIITVCVFVAVIMALFQGWDFDDNLTVGVIVGLFFSLWCGLEIAIGLLFWGESKRTGVFLFLGYLLTWICCVVLIFNL